MINKPSLTREYNRDPTIKAFKGRGFINHGSTLMLRVSGSRLVQGLGFGFYDLGFEV